MNADFEGRIDELESRLAFQDDILENLDQVVARQDREILELKQRLADLSAQFKEFGDIEGADGSAPGFEVPPHY